MKKVVRIISTVGKQKATVETSATTWGEFKSEIRSSYDLGSVKAMVGETQGNLEVDGALLPVGNFTLYLTQAKTKSGASSYKELREEIKKIKETIPADQFKAAFGNYTQSTAAQLQELVDTYKKKSGSKTTAAPAVAKAEPAKKTVVTPIAALAEEIVAPVVAASAPTITLDLPIGLIPAGTYVVAFTEAEADAFAKLIKY